MLVPQVIQRPLPKVQCKISGIERRDVDINYSQGQVLSQETMDHRTLQIILSLLLLLVEEKLG